MNETAGYLPEMVPVRGYVKAWFVKFEGIAARPDYGLGQPQA
jgi:hypothetical protein